MKILMIVGVLALGLLVTYRPLWFVVATTAMVPLESFVVTLLAYAHIHESVLFAFQFSIEASIYYALALVVLSRLIADLALRRTPLDAPLLAVLAVVMLGVAVNNSPIVGSVMNLRSALRYAAVFYLVVNLGLTRRQVSLWCCGLSCSAGLAQVGSSECAQWVVGEDLRQS